MKLLNKDIFEKLLDILFPKRCLYCKKYGEYICENCLERMDNRPIFQKIYNNYFDYVICGSFYNGVIRTQIHNFKFHEQSYLYKYFINLSLNDKKVCNFLKKFDLITYVPMTRNKENRRGYNQAKLLAKELGKKLNIPVIDTLEKKFENKVQSTLSERERMQNVEAVFYFKGNIDINNKNLILVDDILTTGATVSASSKILKENKANKICVFTIAKTLK